MPGTSLHVRFGLRAARSSCPSGVEEKMRATSSEDWSRDGVAAWIWLTRGYEVRRGLPSEYSLSASKFSRLVAVADVIMPLPILFGADGPWLYLGHSTWSLMVLPVW